MIGNIGPMEIGIVLVVALLVFGPKRLPDLGNGLGRGIREFKDSVTGDHPSDEGNTPEPKPLDVSQATPTTTESPALTRE